MYVICLIGQLVSNMTFNGVIRIISLFNNLGYTGNRLKYYIRQKFYFNLSDALSLTLTFQLYPRKKQYNGEPASKEELRCLWRPQESIPTPRDPASAGSLFHPFKSILSTPTHSPR